MEYKKKYDLIEEVDVEVEMERLTLYYVHLCV